MQVRFFNIDWNMTDDSKETRTPAECGLPSECVLEVDNDIDLAEDGADVLSQEYGWLLNGCSWEVVEGDAGKQRQGNCPATRLTETATPRHNKTIRIPLEICFTTDPDELDDRRGEPVPTTESLVAWLKDSLVLQVDTEGYGQPVGAVFAASGIDWNAAKLIEAQDTSHQ